MFLAQITVFVLISASLGGIFVYTDVYDDTESGVVSVLCLSCIKLEPKTSHDYTFSTAKGKHPDFVLENLSYGPVLLHYSKSACDACDEMLPTFQNYFNLSFDKEDEVFKRFNFYNTNFTYIYIYIDREDISKKLSESWQIYDKDDITGIPMFVFITREYHHSGEIKPFYTTVYGAFKKTDEERLDYLNILIKETIEIYNRNNN